MNRLIWLAVAIFTLVCTSLAADLPDPAATSGNTTYSNLDAFGDIVGTIPSTNPGANNAWVGMAWANGELIQCKNVYPSSVPSQFLRINPSTGAVIATVNLPFNGYVIGCTYDGSNLWVVQWSPLNMVYKVSLTGTQVSSFAPNVSPYSARSAAWDGTYLYIGCDQALNTTKLVKFSTTGTNVQEWTTGTAVGWWMDAEFSTNAPTGANLYTVDNGGNTIKRLNVGATVTVAAQVASPATSPDVAEGLAFDGEYLWHCGAYASAGLVWKIDDGYPSTPPNLNVTLAPVSPPIVIPAGGGSFSFNASVVNNGPNQVPFMVWARIKNPDNTYTAPTLGPLTVNPPVGSTITRLRIQNVPATWAPGLYYEIGYAGMSVSYPAADADSFSWTKSADFNGGPLVFDANCYGELFPGEVPVAAPAAYGVVKASPNPFNPTTTISFSLPATQQVLLNVYDAQGRLVSTLVNGLREAGSHSVTFDGSNLASGVYLYTLQAGSQVTSGKMMLLK